MKLRWLIKEADMLAGGWLEWNPHAKIMETTHDAHFATAWDTEADAQRAADFYAPIWRDTNRGSLKVIGL